MKKLWSVIVLLIMFSAVSAQKADQYNLVSRDRALPIVCKDNGEITQGSNMIGKFKISDQKPELNSNEQTSSKMDWVEFYLITDVIICKATKVADKEYQVYTYKDNTTITFTITGNTLNSLTQYLVSKGYL